MATVRIGILRDVPAPAVDDFGGNALRMTFDAANRAGGVDGMPIELVTRDVAPSAAGTHRNVEAAVATWEQLVHDDEVLGLIGPCTTPAVLGVHSMVESVGVPAIHWAGTDLACGRWHFQFQAGYFPDEGPALAFLLAHDQRRKVVCFHGEGAYGEAYIAPFVRVAEELGIDVVAMVPVPVTATDVRAYVDRAQRSNADAIVAMGLFFVGVSLAQQVRAVGWEVACYGNCGFALGAAHNADARAALDGWISTDMFDPCNRTTSELLDEYEARHGVRPLSASPSFGRDLATLMIEGLRSAPELTRAGLRAGLESVRNVPAATGGAGTWMGFGPDDRVALKGPRVFVFSEIGRDAVRFHPR